jgi:hypothetical protein
MNIQFIYEVWLGIQYTICSSTVYILDYGVI